MIKNFFEIIKYIHYHKLNREMHQILLNKFNCIAVNVTIGNKTNEGHANGFFGTIGDRLRRFIINWKSKTQFHRTFFTSLQLVSRLAFDTYYAYNFFNERIFKENTDSSHQEILIYLILASLIIALASNLFSPSLTSNLNSYFFSTMEFLLLIQENFQGDSLGVIT